MTIAGKPVVAVLLEEAIEIAAEFYLAITLERSARRPLLIFSTQGGMDIEQVARSNPAALQRVAIDPLLGLRDFQVRSLCLQAGLEFEHWQALVERGAEPLAALSEPRTRPWSSSTRSASPGRGLSLPSMPR